MAYFEMLKSIPLQQRIEVTQTGIGASYHASIQIELSPGKDCKLHQIK